MLGARVPIWDSRRGVRRVRLLGPRTSSSVLIAPVPGRFRFRADRGRPSWQCDKAFCGRLCGEGLQMQLAAAPLSREQRIVLHYRLLEHGKILLPAFNSGADHRSVLGCGVGLSDGGSRRAIEAPMKSTKTIIDL